MVDRFGNEVEGIVWMDQLKKFIWTIRFRILRWGYIYFQKKLYKMMREQGW